MKVRELVEKLQKINQDLEVVLCVTNEMGESMAWDHVFISIGWEPSGVVSIESTHENLVMF